MTSRIIWTRFVLALVLCAGAVASAQAQSASTWFLAEGASNGTFDEDILVGNPSASTLTVTVKLLPAPDAIITPSGALLEKVFTLPATGRLTVNVGREFPALNGAASAQVSAVIKDTATPADIVVERSMFFPLAGTPYAGGTGASGVIAPARRWILAEGAAGVFETFILVVNPGAAPATVTIRYLRGDGAAEVSTRRTIAPGTRETLWPSQQEPALASQGFSTVVESDQPVVAERAMYFDSFRSGHDALGVTGGRRSWYFAEGFTGGNATIAFETFLLIGNDNAAPATVTATFFRDSGVPVSRTYTVLPRSRFNIWTDQEPDNAGNRLLPASAFSVRLESDVPIVAERAMYWGTPSAADPTTPVFPWKEGHVVAGIPQPENRWAFAEGRQGEDPSGVSFDSFFLVVNPNASPIQVRATFATEDGTGVTTTTTLPANARANIWPAVVGDPVTDPKYALLQGRRFAVFLESVGEEPFVAERAMYWSAFVGGHANAGTAWTAAIATPTQPPADVKVAAMSPSSGRLSGGTVVTITGESFGSSATVYVGGVAVRPTSIGPNAITFTMPARTAATGFGAAGPLAVSVSAQGRFVRAPNFTRYFSVLAFGDSLTWGTQTTYVAGLKVSVQASRPYPRELKSLLDETPQFRGHALVSNAGWPGEWATVPGFNDSPGGVARSARCTAGQANCFYPTSPDPRDFLTPHDVIVVLHGVNDLNNAVSPSRVQGAIRSIVTDAKARGLQVLLALFGPYGVDERSGEPATIPTAVRDYNRLLDALAVEQAVSRESVSAQMGPDGLHPTQTGYDELADAMFRKLLTMFPR